MEKTAPIAACVINATENAAAESSGGSSGPLGSMSSSNTAMSIVSAALKAALGPTASTMENINMVMSYLESMPGVCVPRPNCAACD